MPSSELILSPGASENILKTLLAMEVVESASPLETGFVPAALERLKQLAADVRVVPFRVEIHEGKSLQLIYSLDQLKAAFRLNPSSSQALRLTPYHTKVLMGVVSTAEDYVKVKSASPAFQESLDSLYEQVTALDQFAPQLEAFMVQVKNTTYESDDQVQLQEEMKRLYPLFNKVRVQAKAYLASLGYGV
jgi:hypothetical protein